MYNSKLNVVDFLEFKSSSGRYQRSGLFKARLKLMFIIIVLLTFSKVSLAQVRLTHLINQYSKLLQSERKAERMSSFERD